MALPGEGVVCEVSSSAQDGRVVGHHRAGGGIHVFLRQGRPVVYFWLLPRHGDDDDDGGGDGGS